MAWSHRDLATTRKPKLASEKPKGETVAYETLLETWKQAAAGK